MAKKQRILIVSHFFDPEPGAPSVRLGFLAAHFTAKGRDVSILAPVPNHPDGVVRPGYRRKLRVDELHSHGFKVHRTWLLAANRGGTTRKTIGHITFAVAATIRGWSLEKPDVVVASTPTLFSVVPAVALARRWRIPLVLEVRDLWPASMIELGALRPGIIANLLERFELWLYRQATSVIGVTQGICDNITERTGRLVERNTNGADMAFLRQAHEPQELPPDLDPDVFNVLYLGTMGMAHALDRALEAAHLIRNEPVHFWFVGDGAMKKSLIDQATRLRLDNVTFVAPVERDRVPAYLATGDACLLTLRDIPLFAGALPSKAFEYLGAGRPTIGAVRGEIAEVLGEAGACVVPPESPQELADAILALASSSERRAAMSAQAVAYASAHFDRIALADAHLAIIDAAALDKRS